MASFLLFTRVLKHILPPKIPEPVVPVGNLSIERANLSVLFHLPEDKLPLFVRESSIAMKYLRLLGPIDWKRLAERAERFAPDCPPLSYAAFLAACLVKIDQQKVYMADLHEYLLSQPALVWVLGFPLHPSPDYSWGFDVSASLPTHRHFCRLLCEVPEEALTYLLDETVRLIRLELKEDVPNFGDCISLDTKHVIAWVQENNPKAYVTDRYDKTKQPSGDPDCKLGCKRKHNQRPKTAQPGVEGQPTPLTNPVSAKGLAVGEYYWGYGSGIVATKEDDWGEFVLAELTQPFDQADVAYFHPLIHAVECRLGRKPRFGAFDAAFDAFYTYEYFAEGKGFAAVPFVERGGQGKRQFSPEGAPLCAAGLPMFLRYTFQSKKTLIPHPAHRYACPLRFPKPTGDICPIPHKNWAKQGCVSTLAASDGARLRYQIDRDSPEYHNVYRQRTATERVNSQAVDLGIERPKLRNGRSIAHYNSLIYILINLHALQRIRQRKAARSRQMSTKERAGEPEQRA
jgi:hypothetical protein